MAIEGGCYCGAVRYAADGDVAFKGQCHCRECQYITGGSANVFVGVPKDAYRYTKGAPKAFERSDLETPVRREFCGECGTHLVTFPTTAPMAIIKVGTLDDPTQFDAPQMAFYTIEKQSFHHIPEGCRAFERLPG